MRLFVAVELDAAARDALARAAADLGRLKPVAAGPPLKWVAPAALHLTLRFIGEVDAARGARVTAALEPPLAVAPFDVLFAGVGAFPPRGAPRVIWAGVARGAERLTSLADAVERRVREAGEPAEARPFAAHLTLARARDRGRPARGDELRAALAARARRGRAGAGRVGHAVREPPDAARPGVHAAAGDAAGVARVGRTAMIEVGASLAEPPSRAALRQAKAWGDADGPSEGVERAMGPRGTTEPGGVHPSTFARGALSNAEGQGAPPICKEVWGGAPRWQGCRRCRSGA